MNEKLHDLYYDPKSGFLSLSKFYQKVKAQGIQASYGDVKRFYDQQTVPQITKQVKRPTEFSNIYSPFPLSSVQLDIMVYDRYQIHKYRYVLGVIDDYSRYVIAKPMTNKELPTIMKTLKEIFKEFEDLTGKDHPDNINCDNEFNKKQFVDYFTEQGTKLWFSEPDQPHKNALIERWFRTVALLLQRYRQGINNFDWAKSLPEVVENYNTTYHRTIKSNTSRSNTRKKKKSNREKDS